MSPALPRLIIAVAALTMLPACLAASPGFAPSSIAGGSTHITGTLVQSNAALPALRTNETGGTSTRGRLSRLRRSVLCRDGVWTSPE